MSARTAMDQETDAQRHDVIVLTIPTGAGYRGVATLVVGGVGSRLDLPYERMDDLQLAVLSMLDATDAEEASVEIDVDDDRVAVSVGPLRAGAVGDDGLDRVLTRLTDGVEARRRGAHPWLTVFLAREPASSPPA